MAVNYSNHDISTSGLITASSGNFTHSLQVNGTGVSLTSHSHSSFPSLSLGGASVPLANFLDIVVPSGFSLQEYQDTNVFSINNIEDANIVFAVDGKGKITWGSIDAANVNNFNDTVTSLLPTITNSGNNRILTSTGDSVGVNAESNLTFDGTTLSLSSGYINVTKVNPYYGPTLNVEGVASFGELSDVVSIGNDIIGGEIGLAIANNYLAAKIISDSSFRYGGDEFSPAIVINSGLNIGIGTTSPTQRLHVNENALISSGLYIGSQPLSNIPGLYLRPTDSSSVAWCFLIQNSSYSNLFEIRNDGNAQIGNFTGMSLVHRFNIKGSAATGPSVGVLNVVDSGNSSLFFVHNSGNVGIGTSSPSYKLDVAGDAEFGSNNWLKLIDTGSNNGRLVFSNIGSIDSAGAFLFRNNAGTTEYMRITTGGNVGIGTTSPTSKLHVAGDILASGSSIAGSGSASNPSFEFVGDTDTGMFAPATNTIGLATSGVERLRINNAGNVGIGTSFPTSPLHTQITEVSSQDSVSKFLSSQNTTTSDYNWKGRILCGAENLTFLMGTFNNMAGLGAHSWTSAKDGTGPAWANMYFNPDGPAKVFIGSTTAWTEDQGILCVDNMAGAVGIGTSTPSEALHVVGTSLFSNVVQIGSSTDILPGTLNIYTNDSSDLSATINLKNSAGANRLSITVNDDDSSSVISSTSNALYLTNSGRTISLTANQTNIDGNVNIDGNLTFDSFTESVVAIGNSSTSQTIDLTSGTVQTCTLTSNCTFTMPTATAGKSFSLFLNTGSGGFTASFTGVRWSDSTPPTITSAASKVDLLSFISDGSFWYGSFSQNYG